MQRDFELLDFDELAAYQGLQKYALLNNTKNQNLLGDAHPEKDRDSAPRDFPCISY